MDPRGQVRFGASPKHGMKGDLLLLMFDVLKFMFLKKV